MANWDAIVNIRMMMGRSRSLCLALNAAREEEGGKRREETRGNPIFGEGDCTNCTKNQTLGKGPRERQQ